MARKSDLVDQATKWAGCYTIYACRFASGLTKVGLSSDLPKRIASHWGHGLTGLQSFHACEASSEAHMREAEKAAHELWGRPINRKDSREVFETRGSPADDLKRLLRAVDDTSPIGWKRRRRLSVRRLVRRILFAIFALLVVVFVIKASNERRATDARQQSLPAAASSVSMPSESVEASVPGPVDRLSAAKLLIDERVNAVKTPPCSDSVGGDLSVHVTFDRIGAASGFEVVHPSNDPDYDTCKVGAMRSALGQLLYINGLPFVGDVIYAIHGNNTTLELAPVATSAPTIAAVPESSLPPDVEQFVATHMVTADCDSRASCLALYAKTVATANAGQPASAVP